MGLVGSCDNGQGPDGHNHLSLPGNDESRCTFGYYCQCAKPQATPRGDAQTFIACGEDVFNSLKQKHLVINMDINKTVIMSDRVAGKSSRDVVNEALSNVIWGADVDGKWTLRSSKPSSVRPVSENPGEELLSYSEWLEQMLPGSKNKKERQKRMHRLTDEDQPGASLESYTQRAMEVLKFPDGTDMGIVPAFFDFLVYLKRRQRSFTLCFRTFGEDLATIADELNMFCEGRHPLYPDVRMDGSDAQPDYRFNISDPNACGTFHRTESCTSLVMGTVEQAGEGRFKDETDRSLKFYECFQGVTVISGMFEVQQYLKKRYQKCGTLGLRDYFHFWKKKDMQTDGGKPFFYDARTLNRRHELFFDDNICYSNCQIVEPINLSVRGHHSWPIPLLQTHLVRVEPWDAIYDRNYFVTSLARLEVGYARKLAVRKRLRLSCGTSVGA
jgi:hypothetical protein